MEKQRIPRRFFWFFCLMCMLGIHACVPARLPTVTPNAANRGDLPPTSTTPVDATPLPTPSTVAASDSPATLTPPPVTPSLRPSQPTLPYRAWAIDPDGQLYLLDGAGRVHRLAPGALISEAASAPLFRVADPGPSYLAVDGDFIVASSTAHTRTVALARDSFMVSVDLEQAGPLALGTNGRLFQIAQQAVWSHNLHDPGAPPRPVTEWPLDVFTARPTNLAVDTVGGLLLVTLHDISGSPPHQRESYSAYDLDSLAFLRSITSQLGVLTKPSVAPGGGVIIGGMAAKNGFLGSSVIAFDREGREIASAQPFDGKPLIDAEGKWVYVLRERGLWVLRAADMLPVAADPYTGTAPLDLLLSPDGALLYSVNDDGLQVQETAALRAAGFVALPGPLPAHWFDEAQGDWFRARFYPVPGAPDVAFVQVGGYGETWRTVDAGTTWHLLPGLVYPNFHYATHLSISPEFTADRTLVAFTSSVPHFVRSTDGGDTWAAWDPPVAFVSDRDGNREIYTANRGRIGGDVAQNLTRRTADGAAEENPAWSPGWTRIAFQSNRNGNWDIFTMRAECDPAAADAAVVCDLRQITDSPADDILPAWSPDGRRLAFVSTRDGNPDIYLVSANGGPAQRLALGQGGYWRPTWLPDSQRLLYTTQGASGTNDIFGSRVLEDSAGPTVMQSLPVVTSPGDDRDAAAARDVLVYLSDETGIGRTHILYSAYSSPIPGTATPGTEAEGHPAPLDDTTGALLLTLERGGQTGIYRATISGYEPFVVGPSFNGQPAAGPVPWLPDAEWSAEAYRSFGATSPQ